MQRCNDQDCYRGTVSRDGYQFIDGPCQSSDCQWPNHLSRRKHFADTPSTPIVDGGAEAILLRSKWEKGERWW